MAVPVIPVTKNPDDDAKTPVLQTIKLTSTELANYPELPHLTNMINEAFTTAARKNPGIYQPDRKRYPDPQDLLDDMGPDGITFVTFTSSGAAQDHPELVATTGYKPWSTIWKLQARTAASFTVKDFPQRTEIAEDVPRVEVVAVAVDPRFQNCGLASRLLERATESILEDVRLRGGGMVRVMVRTVKEVNERFWSRRGFQTLREITFGAGAWGSEREIVILEMFKDA